MVRQKEVDKLQKEKVKLEKALGVIVGLDLRQSDISGSLYDELSPWEKALVDIDFDMPESVRSATAGTSRQFTSTPNPPPSIWACTDDFEYNYGLCKKWWRSDEGYTQSRCIEEVTAFRKLSYEEKQKYRKNRDLILKQQEQLKRNLLGLSGALFVTPECSNPSRERGLSLDTTNEGEVAACVTFSNEGDDLVDQRMKEITDEIERKRQREEDEDATENQRGRVRLESEKGFSRGAFALSSNENLTQVRSTKVRPSTHLATTDIRNRFQRVTMLLIELLNSTDSAASQDGSLFNEFMLINCRNVQYTKKKPGKQQMNHLGKTEVTIIGRNKDALLKSVHLLACGVLNESTGENQVSPIYIANTEASSLEDVAKAYFEKIALSSSEFDI